MHVDNRCRAKCENYAQSSFCWDELWDFGEHIQKIF